MGIFTAGDSSLWERGSSASLTIFCHLRAKSRNLSRSSTVGAETERAVHTCAMVRWTGWQSRRGLRGPARSPCLGSLPCEVQEIVTALGPQKKWEDSPEGYPQNPPYQWWNLHDEYSEAA